MMRLLCVAILLALVGAMAGLALGDELTADEVVDRMLADNSAWLKADFESISYVLTKHWYGQTIKVWYRTPGDLRVEWQPASEIALFRDGRGYLATWWAYPQQWDEVRIRDTAMHGLVFRGGAYALANHRKLCRIWEVRREQVDARDAYRVTIDGYYPTDFGLTNPPPPTEHDDKCHLWIDADTFRPLREAWDEDYTPEDMPMYVIRRYADYQPFPAGGEAPMRVEEYRWPNDLPLNAEPPQEPGLVSRYHVVDGKYWFRRSSERGDEVEEEVAQISTAPLAATVFDDAELARMNRAAWLYEEAKVFEEERRWDKLLEVCDEIITIGLGIEHVLPKAVRLHFWRGDYERVAEMRKLRGPELYYRRDLYFGWAYDALGKREEALEAYRKILERMRPDAWPPEVKRAVEEPWVPITKRLQAAEDERLLKPAANWRAESNAEGERPEAAIDGDRRSRWVSAEEQVRGMWFQVDLGAPTTLKRVVFDFVGDLTLLDDGYPNDYRVEVSTDGERWDMLAQGRGTPDNLVEAAFAPRAVRYVRMTINQGEDRPQWSIHEIFFYAPKLGK